MAKQVRHGSLPGEWLCGFAGASAQGECEWLAAQILLSIEDPTSIDPPLHRDVLRLRVRAEAKWRERWLQYVDELSASAAIGFHRILRVMCESDIPAPPKVREPYELNVTLSVVFGRVSLLIHVYATEIFWLWSPGASRRRGVTLLGASGLSAVTDVLQAWVRHFLTLFM